MTDHGFFPSTELTASSASAYLFANGNAIYFDHVGEPDTELQALGLCGLHGFALRYPEATVYWATWGKYAEVIPRDLLPWLLRHLRLEPTERPDG